MSQTPTPLSYRERLSVPVRWWLLGGLLVLSLWAALVVAVPGPVPWVVAFLAIALLVACLMGYGGAWLEVDNGWFRAGRARIEGIHLGAVEALDAQGARRVSGVDADARAYLLLRPYLRRAVRVELTDPSDPTPYWLVSTRHPERLAAALDALRRATAAG